MQMVENAHTVVKESSAAGWGGQHTENNKDLQCRLDNKNTIFGYILLLLIKGLKPQCGNSLHGDNDKSSSLFLFWLLDFITHTFIIVKWLPALSEDKTASRID